MYLVGAVLGAVACIALLSWLGSVAHAQEGPYLSVPFPTEGDIGTITADICCGKQGFETLSEPVPSPDPGAVRFVLPIPVDHLYYAIGCNERLYGVADAWNYRARACGMPLVRLAPLPEPARSIGFIAGLVLVAALATLGGKR